MSGRCRDGSCGGPRMCRRTTSWRIRMGCPFCRARWGRDLFFSAAILFAVAFCAAVFGPYGPSGVPDPSIIQTVPKPDFFFLWLYTVLSYLPPSMETPFILIVPAVAVAILIALPFVAGVA